MTGGIDRGIGSKLRKGRAWLLKPGTKCPARAKGGRGRPAAGYIGVPSSGSRRGKDMSILLSGRRKDPFALEQNGLIRVRSSPLSAVLELIGAS